MYIHALLYKMVGTGFPRLRLAGLGRRPFQQGSHVVESIIFRIGQI
jgi:hypothetical protein